jgi:small subunit ribosomal protein S5
VCELAGIHDVLTKSLRSDNVFNVVLAAIAGLKAIRTPEAVAASRGKTVDELFGVEKS